MRWYWRTRSTTCVRNLSCPVLRSSPPTPSRDRRTTSATGSRRATIVDRTRRAVAAGAAGIALLLAACGGGGARGTPAGNKDEGISWWTSGSENAALNVIFDNFKKSAPGVDIVNAAVVGG